MAEDQKHVTNLEFLHRVLHSRRWVALLPVFAAPFALSFLLQALPQPRGLSQSVVVGVAAAAVMFGVLWVLIGLGWVRKLVEGRDRG